VSLISHICDIQHHVKGIYNHVIITDAIIEKAKEWQNRPLIIWEGEVHDVEAPPYPRNSVAGWVRSPLADARLDREHLLFLPKSASAHGRLTSVAKLPMKP